MTDLAVLILNWNGQRWLEACVEAVLAQTGCRFTVCVVDNGSTDGSAQAARQRFPQVRLLALGANLGYGVAYNRAVEAIDCPLLLLLNNDAFPQPGCLAALSGELRDHPRCAAVGAKLLHLERPNVINHAGGKLTVFGSGYDLGFGMPDQPGFDVGGITGCATGAAMLVRREAFLAVGGFDETYFAYFDDTDLCWRFWLHGWTVRYVPTARVLHAYGGSSPGGRFAPLRVKLCEANRLQNMVKHLEGATLAWALPASLSYDALGPLAMLARRRPAAARAFVDGVGRFLRLLPHALGERRRIQTLRKPSDAELRDLAVLVGVRETLSEGNRLRHLRD